MLNSVYKPVCVQHPTPLLLAKYHFTILPKNKNKNKNREEKHVQAKQENTFMLFYIDD